MTKPTDKKPSAAPAPAPTPAPAPAPAPALTPAAENPTSEPIKRGRGRPRKEDSAPVSPSEAGAASASGGKKPGRKKSKVTFDAEALGVLSKQVMGLHQLMALATGIPELQINDTEAKMLADAIGNVCEEYDFSLSGKTGALLQLAAAGAMVYAPRFVLVTQRVKAAQTKREMHVVQGGKDADTPHS